MKVKTDVKAGLSVFTVGIGAIGQGLLVGNVNTGNQTGTQ
jgi:hypothetical protein